MNPKDARRGPDPECKNTCQCASCTQLQTCRLHRGVAVKNPYIHTPYPCRGCKGANDPLVKRMKVDCAMCQTLAWPQKKVPRKGVAQ